MHTDEIRINPCIRGKYSKAMVRIPMNHFKRF